MNSSVSTDRERVTTLLLINTHLMKKAINIYHNVLINQQTLNQLLPQDKQSVLEHYQNYTRRLHCNLQVLSFIHEKYHTEGSTQNNRTAFPYIVSAPPDMPELNQWYGKLQELYPERMQFLKNKMQQMKENKPQGAIGSPGVNPSMNMGGGQMNMNMANANPNTNMNNYMNVNMNGMTNGSNSNMGNINMMLNVMNQNINPHVGMNPNNNMSNKGSSQGTPINNPSVKNSPMLNSMAPAVSKEQMQRQMARQYNYKFQNQNQSTMSPSTMGGNTPTGNVPGSMPNNLSNNMNGNYNMSPMNQSAPAPAQTMSPQQIFQLMNAGSPDMNSSNGLLDFFN